MTERILSSLLTVCLTLGLTIARVRSGEGPDPDSTEPPDRQAVTPATARVPAIPALSTWKSNMTTLGQKWAAWLDNPKNLPLAFGVEQEVWYYDGGRVYYQIADYTHDPKWYKYGDQILSAYADYVISNHGGVPGYRIFPYGLYMGWQRTHNPKYAEALDQMVSGSRSISTVQLRYNRQHLANGAVNPQWVPQYIRESAYYADVYLVDWMRTGKQNSLLQVAIWDCVVADLNEFMRPGSKSYLGSGTNGNVINNFMIGLALETLTHYYDLTTQGEAGCCHPSRH